MSSELETLRAQLRTAREALEAWVYDPYCEVFKLPSPREGCECWTCTWTRKGRAALSETAPAPSLPEASTMEGPDKLLTNSSAQAAGTAPAVWTFQVRDLSGCRHCGHSWMDHAGACNNVGCPCHEYEAPDEGLLQLRLGGSAAPPPHAEPEGPDLRTVAEGLALEFEAAVRHAEWRAEGSKGMYVPFHGDFAAATQLPSVVGRMRWWARELRRALLDRVGGTGEEHG